MRHARWRAWVTATVVVCLSAVGTASPIAGQTPGAAGFRVEIGVVPATVRVGEPFRTAVRVVAPPGEAVEIGEFIPDDSLTAAAPAEVGRDDEEAATAVFPLVAWVAGERLTSSIPVRITAADGSTRTIAVSLRLPEVVSILPPAEEGGEVAPRPPHGLIPLAAPSSFSWWWLAFLLAALAVAVGAAARRYLRREAPGIAKPPVDPREWALAQLGQDGAGGLLTSRDLPALTTHVSRVVRAYLGRVKPELGEDLTSTEVVGELGETGVGGAAAPALRGILAVADRVKFSLHRPTFEEAERLLADARGWISTYPPPETATGGNGPGGPGPGDSGPGGGAPRGSADRGNADPKAGSPAPEGPGAGGGPNDGRRAA